MAIEYALRLGVEVDPDTLLDHLAATPPFTFGGTFLHAPGITSVYIGKEDRFGQDVVWESFKVVPKVFVWFCLDKFENTERGLDAVALAMQAILERFPGPAVLLRSNEVVVAINRRSRRLLLNSEESFWAPHRISLVRMPHDLKDYRPDDEW